MDFMHKARWYTMQNENKHYENYTLLILAKIPQL